LLLVVFSSLAGCSADESTPVAVLGAPVLYDRNDRQELYLLPASDLRRAAEHSVVALIQDSVLQDDGVPDALEAFSARAWAVRRELCPGIDFAEQPAAATCSGFLVDADLVLTAGHCAATLRCSELNIVFGYHYTGDGQPARLTGDDVYRCAEVLAFEVPGAGTQLDYGWLRLDRPVTADKTPLPIARSAQPIETDERLQLLGHPGGVPLKVQLAVKPLSARSATLDYFVTAADAFEGDSGGPLLRDGRQVVGILARGNSDYSSTPSGCFDVAQRSESQGAEQATYAFRALDELCRAAPGSTELCRTSAAGGGCSFSSVAEHTAWHAWLLASSAMLAFALRRLLVR